MDRNSRICKDKARQDKMKVKRKKAVAASTADAEA